MRKYGLPEFLKGVVSQDRYERWLHRKAVAHVRRDRKSGTRSATNENYKLAIHEAVRGSNGVDAYTGETLDWSLISKYDNTESEQAGRKYKKGFALLPTVDHKGDRTGPADFTICGWGTNDAKNDLPYEEFLELCKRVVAYAAEEVVEDDAAHEEALLKLRDSLWSEGDRILDAAEELAYIQEYVLLGHPQGPKEP